MEWTKYWFNENQYWFINIWRPGDKNICSAVSNKNKISSVYIPNNNILGTEISIQKSYANTIKRHHKNPFIKKKFLILTFKNILKNYKVNLEKFNKFCSLKTFAGDLTEP